MKVPNLKKWVALGALACSAAGANAASVLIFGDYPIGDLASRLTAQGHTVTTVSGLGIPADLSGFDTVWVNHIFASFNSVAPRLQSFLNAGGGIHFTGERPCCEAGNDSIQAFLNANVRGGGIQVGDLGDTTGPYTFNSAAVGGVTAGLSAWVPSASGAITGVSGDNILTSSSTAITGAVFDSGDLVGGFGRITVLMDINWYTTDPNRGAIIGNLQTFLQNGAAPGQAQVPEPATLLLAATALAGLALRRRA